MEYLLVVSWVASREFPMVLILAAMRVAQKAPSMVSMSVQRSVEMTALTKVHRKVSLMAASWVVTMESLKVFLKAAQLV